MDKRLQVRLALLNQYEAFSCTVDSPQIGHTPDPGKSVAAKIRHFEDFSDLRVSDLRTVNCNDKKWFWLTLSI
jgi:hypothetical protein